MAPTPIITISGKCMVSPSDSSGVVPSTILVNRHLESGGARRLDYWARRKPTAPDGSWTPVSLDR